MKTSSVIVTVGLFIFIAGTASGLYIYKQRAINIAKSEPAFEPPNAVTLVSPRVVKWQPKSDLVGTVIAKRMVNVQNEVEGLVNFVGFKSGDIVEANHILVKLDDASDQAELESAKASLKVAEADERVIDTQVKFAESELRRQLAAGNATSVIEVERAQAESEKAVAERSRAEASILEARAKIAEVQTRIDKHVIRAPFRATVGLRTVHEGQFLAQQFGGETSPIATLQEVSDTIYIDFAVPQELLSRVKVGLEVEGVIDDTGSSGDGARPILLRVAATDASANNATRNIRVRSIVDNKDSLLKPGMYVKIRVPIEALRDYTVIPVTAVRRASYANLVYMITTKEGMGPDGKPAPEMRSSQRIVKLGPTIGEDVIVLDGLKVGDMIASSGSFKLSEGALVIPAMPGELSGHGGPVAVPVNSDAPLSPTKPDESRAKGS